MVPSLARSLMSRESLGVFASPISKKVVCHSMLHMLVLPPGLLEHRFALSAMKAVQVRKTIANVSKRHIRSRDGNARLVYVMAVSCCHLRLPLRVLMVPSEVEVPEFATESVGILLVKLYHQQELK